MCWTGRGSSHPWVSLLDLLPRPASLLCPISHQTVLPQSGASLGVLKWSPPRERQILPGQTGHFSVMITLLHVSVALCGKP